jgi:hypothetical protein
MHLEGEISSSSSALIGVGPSRPISPSSTSKGSTTAKLGTGRLYGSINSMGVDSSSVKGEPNAQSRWQPPDKSIGKQRREAGESLVTKWSRRFTAGVI